MSITVELFEKHGDKLSAEEQTAMVMVVQRIRNIEDLIANNNLSHALIKIEPVQSDEAVVLFGQSVKSLAFNRLSLYTAVLDEEKGNYVPGLHLFSALMSEQALCNLTLNMNRHDYAPMTATEAMGEKLEVYSQSRKGSVELVTDDNTKRAGELRKMLDEVIERFKAESQKASVGKNVRAEMISLLNIVSRVGEERDFFLDRVIENLAKDKSAAQIEIANAINSTFNSLKNTLALPGVGQTLSRQNNVILDALQDYNSLAERDIMFKLVCMEQRDFVEKHGAEFDVDAPSKAQSNNALAKALPWGASDKDKAYAESLGSYRNRVENPHILENYAKGVTQQAGISGSRITGNSEKMFSEYDSDAGTFYEFEIANTYEDGRYGNLNVAVNDRILTFQMTAEDLMNAIRGFVNGGYVPCTISRFAGRKVDFVPYHNAGQNEVKADAKLAASMSRELRKTTGAITEKLNKTISRKADKEEILSMLEALPEIFEKAVEKDAEEFEHYANQMKNMVVEDVKGYLQETHNELKLSSDHMTKIAGLLK